MKILKSVPTKDGKLRLTVVVDAEETLIAVREDRFYRLAYPLDDQVLATHILEGIKRVSWCSVEQKWVDA